MPFADILVGCEQGKKNLQKYITMYNDYNIIFVTNPDPLDTHTHTYLPFILKLYQSSHLDWYISFLLEKYLFNFKV